MAKPSCKAQRRMVVCSSEGRSTEADKPVSCQVVVPAVLQPTGAPPLTVSSRRAGWPIGDRVSAENCTNLCVAQAALKERMPEQVPGPQESSASPKEPETKFPDKWPRLLATLRLRMGAAAEPSAQGSQKDAPSSLRSPIKQGAQASGPVAPGSGLYRPLPQALQHLYNSVCSYSAEIFFIYKEVSFR